LLVEQVGAAQEYGVGGLPAAVQPERYEHHADAQILGELMFTTEDAACIVKHSNGPQSGAIRQACRSAFGGCYRDRTCGPFRVKEVLYR
jgi:hypothetical protein